MLPAVRNPLQIERAFADLPEANVISQTVLPSGRVAGADGANAYGYHLLVGGDANPDLIPPRRFQVYNEMRNEDSVVRSTLWMFKLAIRAADWSIEAGGSDPIDQAIRDACAWQFGLEDLVGQMDHSWDEQVQQALLMLDFGSMFEEIIVGDAAEWRDRDGDPHLLRTFSRLAPRFPGTIRMPDGIQTDPRTGLIRSLEQWIPGTTAIPGDRLVYYCMEREGNDWLGRSLLRTMYGPWKLKRAVMISAGMGWDRYAFGTPVIRYPGGPQKKREAESIGRNWRAHERGWIVLEGAADQGWDVEIVGGNSTMGDSTPLVRVYNDEMQMSALQHFSALGRTGSGSRAVGDIQVEPFYLAAQALADQIAMQKMRLAFRRFVDLNFGAQFPVPRLNVQKIQARNVATLSAAIQELAAAGMDFTDRDTQNDLRDVLDLRHLPEELVETIQTLPDGVGVQATPNTTVPPPQRAVPPQIAAAAREGDGLRL